MRLTISAVVVYVFTVPVVCFAQCDRGSGELLDFGHSCATSAEWLPECVERRLVRDNLTVESADDTAWGLSDVSPFLTRPISKSKWESDPLFLVRGQSPTSNQSTNTNSGGGDGGGGEDLTSKANDPTAALVSFNVQNFFTTESYEATGHGYSLGLLPVIPIQQKILGFDYMITRPSIPIFGPSVDPFGPVSSESGLGDIFVTNLLIKKESWGAWGLGPSFNLPTATDPALGAREWQIAPSAAVVIPSENKKWLFGGLALAPISLQSNSKSISLQPIVVRFLPNDWYVGNGFQIWNWQTNNGNFSMPLTLRVGRVLKEVKPYPLNISMQAGYTPDDWHQGPAARWQFLFNVTVLMPAG